MQPHALRKAAILIDTLDADGADALLDQMPAEQAARVRAAVMNLGDIDDAERNQIIKEFKTGDQHSANHVDNGIELDDSLAEKIAASRREPQQPPTDSDIREAPPFRFLHQAASDTVSRFLQNEHPQTIAVVISHLPPARAADIVAELPGDMQAEVLQRVVQLAELDEDIIREVEEQIEELLADHLRTTERRSAGLAAATAILKAADLQDRREMIANLQRRDPQMAEGLIGGKHYPAGKQAMPDHFESTYESRTTPDHENDEVTPATVKFPQRPQPAESIVALTFSDLAKLDDISIAVIFQSAEPNVALLALTGADNSLVKRILKQLPARDAKQLKKAIGQVGPVQLRDIEDAQRQIGILASRLASGDPSQTNTTRRLAAVA